ncbi:MAG: hypothetical protein VCA37_08555 [Roseibacillus sp.]
MDCFAITTGMRRETDDSNFRTLWRKGQNDIGSLAGKPVRLKFELKYGAKLYAFRTQAASPDLPSKPPPGKEQSN